MLPHLNFNLVECFAVVHTNHGPNHLRQNDHVSQVGLDHLWFLHGRSLLLCLTQTLQKGLLLATQTTVKPPPLACTVELHKLLTEMKREDSKVNNGEQKNTRKFHICTLQLPLSCHVQGDLKEHEYFKSIHISHAWLYWLYSMSQSM